jgi:hypothetical protein
MLQLQFDKKYAIGSPKECAPKAGTNNRMKKFDRPHKPPYLVTITQFFIFCLFVWDSRWENEQLSISRRKCEYTTATIQSVKNKFESYFFHLFISIFSNKFFCFVHNNGVMAGTLDNFEDPYQTQWW